MPAEFLRKLFKVIIDEAENNPEFSAKIEQIFSQKNPAKKTAANRASNRRDLPVINPIDIIAEGEESLREKLQVLTEKQLKDIISYHGMDHSKRVMKWKKTDKLIEHIIEEAQRISTRGDVFRQ